MKGRNYSRQTDWQTDRVTDRQTEWQRQRETDRNTTDHRGGGGQLWSPVDLPLSILDHQSVCVVCGGVWGCVGVCGYMWLCVRMYVRCVVCENVRVWWWRMWGGRGCATGGWCWAGWVTMIWLVVLLCASVCHFHVVGEWDRGGRTWCACSLARDFHCDMLKAECLAMGYWHIVLWRELTVMSLELMWCHVTTWWFVGSLMSGAPYGVRAEGKGRAGNNHAKD